MRFHPAAETYETIPESGVTAVTVCADRRRFRPPSVTAVIEAGAIAALDRAVEGCLMAAVIGAAGPLKADGCA
jgi:hypothetical protein